MDAPDMVELKYGPADACRTKIFVAAGKSRESAGATAAAPSERAQVADYLNRFHQLAIARSLVHRIVRRSRLLFGAALLATAVPGRRSRAPWRGCCNRRRDALITRIVDAKNEQITKSTRSSIPRCSRTAPSIIDSICRAISRRASTSSPWRSQPAARLQIGHCGSGYDDLVSRPRSPVNTQGGDAPGAQGARRAHTGSM
jgi:hypothetical protein